LNSTLALISGLGLEALGLGLETPGLVNIPAVYAHKSIVVFDKVL